MSAASSVDIPRKLWTRAEVNQLDGSGFLLELICGDLIDKKGKRPPHVFWKSVVAAWLRRIFGEEFVRTEDPVDVDPEDNPTSEPEPDVVVTRRSILQDRGANPKPADIRLVVEIADSTFSLDSRIKAMLYARAGIEEYWLIDVRNPGAPSLWRHTQPRNGVYIVEKIAFDQTFKMAEGHVFGLREIGG